MRAVVRKQADLYRFAEQASDMLDGRPYTVIIKKFHRPRSLDQNAKMHAMVAELAEHTGYSNSEMKEVVKAMYLPMRTIKVGDRRVERPLSTAELTVEQMSELIEHIYQLGAELCCVFSDDETA